MTIVTMVLPAAVMLFLAAAEEPAQTGSAAQHLGLSEEEHAAFLETSKAQIAEVLRLSRAVPASDP
eukprot:CAMPEP_0118862606 /NCGR_PEP_ID=MMETSP1163-20130328/7664_1 /TAXON_ID=124430 /ORGANISM="Phaeomonas parva, Strain CCMP2877" /LENGTH=65 /DNA_ID=CAMNT_0006796523 /DNA_START=69 /DNA_END=263 /DNA_ORIENTATION=-